jgi:hypothetical protein
MTRRCSWCGRFGGRLVRYRLWRSTPVYERNLCRECERSAASGSEAWAVAVEVARGAEPLVERDPETQAVHDRHPNIRQKPLPLDEVMP